MPRCIAVLCALFVGAWLPADARADCAVSPVDGSVINCTGDNAAGISISNGSGPLRTLNVFDLTSNIGGTGIAFTSDADASLDIDAGSFRILTTSPNTSGIYANSASGSVAIEAVADIATGGFNSRGIAAVTDAGDIFISSSGNIATAGSGNNLLDSAFGISAFSNTGNVAVFSSSNITTIGDMAAGISAFSDGDVVVLSTGNIMTTGLGADGIDANSGSGTAMVVSTGNISATGVSSSGIVAVGEDALVINGGVVIGGPCCDGVALIANNSATLINLGSIIGDPTGYAIEAGGATVVVENFGTVTGIVQLLGTSSVFNNHAGALFNSGDFAVADEVTNDGTIAPGGRGSVLTTMMSDDFVQGASGVYAVDLDPRASNPLNVNDYIVASNTATVAGAVDVHFLSLPLTAAETFTILTGMGGLSHGDVGLVASPALHATLLYHNSDDMVLGIAVDYDVPGLNRNQRAIARDLHRIFGGGAGGVAPVLLGLLNVGDLAEYRNALDQLSPEVYSDAQIAALYSTLAFANSLMSCKVNGAGTAEIIREGQCLWAGASAVFLDAGTTSQQIGFTQAAGLFTAGAQVALDDVWRLGVAAGYQSSTIQTSTGARSEGSLGQAGIALKYNPGPLLLAGALTGGGGSYDTSRAMSFGGFTGIAEDDQSLGVVSGTLRAAYVLGSPHLYFKPMLDVSLTHLQLSGFTESGGGAALSVEGQGQTVFSLAPLVETGTEFWLGNGTLVRPLIRGGAIWYDNADLALTASFADAAAGISPFTISSELDEIMGLVGAGIEIISGADAVMRLSYDGQLGETTQIHAVGIKGSARF